MATGSGLVEIVKYHRQVYEQNHPNLSGEELIKGFKRYWNSISDQALGNAGTGNMLPQKRASSSAIVGMDSPSKRSGHDSMATLAHSYDLQRQASAPAGRSSNSSKSNLHPTQMTTSVGSRTIPRQQTRRASAASYSQSVNRPNLHNIDEVQAYSPSGFLAQSLEDHPMSAMSLAYSPGTERGEFQAQTNSYLVAAYNPAFDTSDGNLSPATSDTSLTSASTAISEPMTRSNTNDGLCYGFDMIRMNSHSKPELESGFAKATTDADQDHLFSLSDTSVYHDFSYPVNSFSYGLEMKHSASQDSNTSSHQSVVIDSISVPNKAAQELRPLQPKQSHDAAFAKQSQSPEAKIIEMTLEDGRKVFKAEIARAARQQPPRKTTFCPHCNDQPQGFHGEHELNRHIDRQHRSFRKVWICKDISPNGFLDGCKACRNLKTYGANYNAAAHLRRAHFNPCKNKRGGRGKKSEGRGGMGGGNKPSMDELKHWMYPMYEDCLNGVVTMRPVPPEGQEDIYAAQISSNAVDTAYNMDNYSSEEFEFDYTTTDQFIPDMAASAPQATYTTMAPTMQTMQVPASYYGQVNYMQMQPQPIYIN